MRYDPPTMKAPTRALLVASALLLSASASAEDCPNPERLRSICMFVGNKSEDHSRTDKWHYAYQRRVYEAACVDVDRDSKEERARKISQLWQQEEVKLVCNSLQFDVSNGSILKYAAHLMFDEVIADAIDWKVNLNKVDESDGRTLLDYIQFHRDRALEGSEVRARLTRYYEDLRKAGARHAGELP